MKKLMMVGTAVALVAVLAGCSGGSSSGPAKTIEVTAKNTAFSMKEITIEKGQPVKLVLNNQDGELHDWAVSKIEIKKAEAHDGGDSHGHGNKDLHVSAEGGKTGTVEFTATKAGTYEYICTVPGHKESGMLGKLIVKG